MIMKTVRTLRLAEVNTPLVWRPQPHTTNPGKKEKENIVEEQYEMETRCLKKNIAPFS